MATDIYKPDSHTGNYHADRFFDIISEPKTKPELQQRILSIVKVPFISDTNHRFVNVDGCSILEEDTTKLIKKYSYKPTRRGTLQIWDNIFNALQEPDILLRPIIFLVSSPREPHRHTGIYIYLPNGNVYSLGYITVDFRELFPPGALVSPEHQYPAFCSPDMPFTRNPSVILWFGLLTFSMFDRIQEEINNVTEIRFRTEMKMVDGVNVEQVGNEGKLQLNFVIPHRKYTHITADDILIENLPITEAPKNWNCRIWAIYILFGLSGLNFFWNRKKKFGPDFKYNRNGDNNIISKLINDYLFAMEDDEDEVRSNMLYAFTIMNHTFMPDSEFYNEWYDYISGKLTTIYNPTDGMSQCLKNAKDDFDTMYKSRQSTQSKQGGRTRSRKIRMNTKRRLKKYRKTKKPKKRLLVSCL